MVAPPNWADLRWTNVHLTNERAQTMIPLSSPVLSASQVRDSGPCQPVAARTDARRRWEKGERDDDQGRAGAACTGPIDRSGPAARRRRLPAGPGRLDPGTGPGHRDRQAGQLPGADDGRAR